MKREFGEISNISVDEVHLSYITYSLWNHLFHGCCVESFVSIVVLPHFVLKYNQLLVQNICLKLSRLLLIWAEEQTYWIASRFLMLGFDLELYSPSEYCMVYWYLYVVFIKLLEKVQLRIAGSIDTSECPYPY